MDFKKFLLAEQQEYLADRINDVLTGVHEFLQAKKQMGAKYMLRNAEVIANQIRKILHASWPRSEHKHLKVLQKCGVALMKTIDDKGDLSDTVNNVRGELEKLMQKLHVPVNKLGTDGADKVEQPEAPPPGPQNQEAPQGPMMPPPTPPELPQQ